MTELFKYDEKWVPEVISMRNSGVLCYLNSLVQCLISLPVFNKSLTVQKDKFVDNENHLALSLIKLFTDNYRSPEESTTLRSASLDNILTELIQRRKRNMRDGTLMTGRQEDADEGFHVLLNSLDGDLQNLNSHTSANSIETGFHIRYDTIIKCRACSAERHAGDDEDGPMKFVEPPELTIHIPEYDDVIGRIDNQEAMEKYIMMRSEFPDGYRCEKCGVGNVQGKNVVMKRNVLRRLSSVIVITFKNYPEYNSSGRKALHYFPHTMKFKSKGGILTYQTVAKIEHFGGMSGGHYIAHCKRPVHKTSHNQRIQQYEEFIKKLEVTRSEQNIQQIKQLKRRMRNAKQTTANVFTMNDENIIYSKEGIEPSPNTYMVFYHLI